MAESLRQLAQLGFLSAHGRARIAHGRAHIAHGRASFNSSKGSTQIVSPRKEKSSFLPLVSGGWLWEPESYKQRQKGAPSFITQSVKATTLGSGNSAAFLPCTLVLTP